MSGRIDCKSHKHHNLRLSSSLNRHQYSLVGSCLGTNCLINERGIQPSGIEITGQLSIEIGLPKLNQSNSYVPPSGSYVLLLGLNKTSNQISPVGVGIITNNGHNLKSVGATHFDTLDVFAYTLMPEEAQAALKDYTEDKISLPILLVKVNQAWDEARETARRLFKNNQITQ